MITEDFEALGVNLPDIDLENFGEVHTSDEEDDNEFFINCGKDLTCDRIEKIANDLVKQLLVGE